MSTITWNDLGPREKQLLAILQRAGEPLATRDVLVELREEGFLYAFESATHREALVDSVVDDVANVLGSPGLALLARRAREIRVDADEPIDERDAEDTTR